MDNVLNEIGKLRNEMKLGFIEVDNRLTATNDALLTMNDALLTMNDALLTVNESLKSTQESLVKVANLTNDGFDLIELSIKNTIEANSKRFRSIEGRLNRLEKK